VLGVRPRTAGFFLGEEQKGFMAFTTTDLTNVEAAIVSLATGARVVQGVINGKQVRWQESDMHKLQALRSIIQAELGQVYTRVYAKQGGRATLDTDN